MKEFLRNRCKEILKKCKKYQNVLRVAIRRAKQSYYHSQFTKNAGNPKRLWADLLDVIQKKKTSHELPSKFELDDSIIHTPQIIAQHFNEYYAQVAPTLDATLGPCPVDPLSYLNHIEMPEVLTFHPVSQHLVSNIVAGIKDVGAGVDGINSKLLKLLTPAILPQLTHLVNRCLIKSTFPAVLKTAMITRYL